jgi:hypothetical protein
MSFVVAGQLKHLFDVFRSLAKYMNYAEDCYLTCLQLLSKFQKSVSRIRIRAKMVAVVVFFLYSKMYECRQIQLSQIIELTHHAFTEQDWINIEAHVL